MTDSHYTAIMLLVDRSGSMQSIRVSAEDGINEFIHGQKTTDGRRTIRIAQFDTEYTSVHTSLDAEDVPAFELSPRGGTALLDAMGRSIVDFGKELEAMDEKRRPATVIFAVMTDGRENSSTDYTWERVKSMVRHQEDVYGWQVLYLGANQDAIVVGGQLGVTSDRSLTYTPSGVGTRSAVGSMNSYVSTASTGAPAAFTDDDREKAARNGD